MSDYLACFYLGEIMFSFLKKLAPKKSLSDVEVLQLLKDGDNCLEADNFTQAIDIYTQLLDAPKIISEPFFLCLCHHRLNYCYVKLTDYPAVIANCDRLLTNYFYKTQLRDILYGDKNTGHFISSCWSSKVQSLYVLEKYNEAVQAFDDLFPSLFPSSDTIIHRDISSALLCKAQSLNEINNPECLKALELLIITYKDGLGGQFENETMAENVSMASFYQMLYKAKYR